MALKKIATKRNISALMLLLLMQVLLTYVGVWVALDSKNYDSYPGKLKRQDMAVAFSTQNGGKTATTGVPLLQTNLTTTLGTKDNSSHLKTSPKSKLESENLANVTKEHLVGKVQVSGSKWLLHLFSESKSYCNGKIEMIENVAALFRNAVIDPSLGSAQAQSRANVKDVLLQKELLEFYRLKKGYLKVDDCSDVPAPKNVQIDGGKSDHIKEFNKAVEISTNAADVTHRYDGDFVIMMTRYEYANVYWTVIDLYDAFLMMRFYNRTFKSTDLLLFDAHPLTKLDEIFDGVFRRVIRPRDLTQPTRFRNLVQCFQRGKSPVLRKILQPLPLVNEFRSQVMLAMKIELQPLADRKRRCAENTLNVLFIWRRNYVAHPRNPAGVVARKISNEDELLNITRRNFPKYSVVGEQLDKYPVKRQLEVMGNVDIMVSMHGEAFGFVIFMQEGSGVLEMWPKGDPGNWHMEYLARRNRLYYKSWQNNDEKNEDRRMKATKVSTQIVKDAVKGLSESVCSKYLKDPL